MSGFDTAAYVYDVWEQAVTQFGTPNFWIRYFSPSQTTPINVSSSNACEECLAMWKSGGHYLGPISYPTQTNLSGTTADGQADAQTFANAMQTVYYDVLPLLLPSNNELYCWLDQEAAPSLSVPYWEGWASYLRNFNFADIGSYPLYPGLYCNPCAPPPNCSTLQQSTVEAVAIWSSEPQRCGYTLKNPPPWQADTCPNCGVDLSTPTQLWQFADGWPNGCFTTDVDLDLNASGFALLTHCFNVSTEPTC